jgi:hypothetical protein
VRSRGTYRGARRIGLDDSRSLVGPRPFRSGASRRLTQSRWAPPISLGRNGNQLRNRERHADGRPPISIWVGGNRAGIGSSSMARVLRWPDQARAVCRRSQLYTSRIPILRKGSTPRQKGGTHENSIGAPVTGWYRHSFWAHRHSPMWAAVVAAAKLSSSSSPSPPPSP